LLNYCIPSNWNELKDKRWNELKDNTILVAALLQIQEE
jgi:hypothetical protein